MIRIADFGLQVLLFLLVYISAYKAATHTSVMIAGHGGSIEGLIFGDEPTVNQGGDVEEGKTNGLIGSRPRVLSLPP